MKDKLKHAFHEFFSACWEVLKLPFWLFSQGWQKLVAFGPKRMAIVLAATLVVSIFALTSFVKVTSQPDFCKSCHVMEPYFEAWQTSTHSDVTCTKCHIEPGLEGTIHSKFMALSMVANYFTGIYKRSKPWAEIEDAACLREGCHETRLLKGTEDFKGVRFDHAPHLSQPRRDRELRCTSCHAQIVQGEHITVTGTTCFLCHFKPDSTGEWSDLARCTHCHNPPQGIAASDTSFDHTSVLARNVDCIRCHATEVAGDGFVPIERCNSCHAQKDHAERYNDRDFVHQMHVTEHKVDCIQCHLAIRHGKEAQIDQAKARDCSQCHGGPDNAIEAVWQGILPGFPDTPSSMARAGMSCNSCHTGDVHGNVQAASPTCLPCHEDSYDKLWPRWKQPLLNALNDLSAKAQQLPVAERDTVRKAIDIVRNGNPMHNPDLIRLIAARINGGKSVQDSIGGCAQCHPAAGESVVMRAGHAFDHRIHVREVATCEVCHDVNGERHGKLKLIRDDCNACHHNTKSVVDNTCESCHAIQHRVYTGTLNHAEGEQSVMASAVSCAECHTDGSKIVRRTAETCMGCHDDTYADTLAVWTAAGKQFESKMREQLRDMNKGDPHYQTYRSLLDAYQLDGSASAHNPNLFKLWVSRLEAAP